MQCDRAQPERFMGEFNGFAEQLGLDWTVRGSDPTPLEDAGNEAAGIRTLDLRIKSPLLYQLSYALNHPHLNRIMAQNRILTLYQENLR